MTEKKYFAGMILLFTAAVLASFLCWTWLFNLYDEYQDTRARVEALEKRLDDAVIIQPESFPVPYSPTDELLRSI